MDTADAVTLSSAIGKLTDRVAALEAQHAPTIVYQGADRDSRQQAVVDWCIKISSQEEATSPKQRALRFLEEAAELVQACELPLEKALEIVNYMYARDVGKPAQELGGVGVTLLALANSLGESAEQCEAAEVKRILAKDINECRARNQKKNDAGFLMVQPT